MHSHDSLPSPAIIDSQRNERNIQRVVLLTVVMMGVEVIAGLFYGSMSLLADGWHMGTHAAALGITAFAYYYSRHHANDPRFCFGTGKVGVLGGFTSAVILAIVALLIGLESLHRLVAPEPIQFNEALIVAVLGLIVNLLSAFLLQHKHDDHHHDYNLRSAYFHVLADAMTSCLAIVALLVGKAFGWIWVDAIVGIVGAVIIGQWSYGLLRDTSKILLDSAASPEIITAVRSVLEADGNNKVVDLHVWWISSQQLASIVSLTTHYPKSPLYYKQLLSSFDELIHVTVEINSSNESPSEKSNLFG